MERGHGWTKLPLALKILMVFLVLWTIGSVLALPMRLQMGVPFFGVDVTGIGAAMVVLLLDIFAPTLVVLGTWLRKAWTPLVAYLYMGIFILNGIVTFFTQRAELGTVAILIPSLVTLIFMAIIYFHKNYYGEV